MSARLVRLGLILLAGAAALHTLPPFFPSNLVSHQYTTVPAALSLIALLLIVLSELLAP